MLNGSPPRGYKSRENVSRGALDEHVEKFVTCRILSMITAPETPVQCRCGSRGVPAARDGPLKEEVEKL